MADLNLPIPGGSNDIWGPLLNNILNYLNNSISTASTNISNLTQSLSQKSDIGHTHVATDVINLQNFVDGRIASVGTTSGGSSGGTSSADGYLFTQDSSNPRIFNLYG